MLRLSSSCWGPNVNNGPPVGADNGFSGARRPPAAHRLDPGLFCNRHAWQINLKKKCICKRGITTRERNNFQTLSFKKKYIHPSLCSSTAQHLLSWDIIALVGWLRVSAFPVLSRESGNNCAAWHIPCSASLLPSSLSQPVLSSVKRFKYYWLRLLSECYNKQLNWRQALMFIVFFWWVL